jgi:uncharacterized membrane protein YqaE (UPF0057 family)
MIRRISSTVCEIAGVVLIAIALSPISVWLSIGFVGVALVVASYVLGSD